MKLSRLFIVLLVAFLLVLLQKILIAQTYWEQTPGPYGGSVNHILEIDSLTALAATNDGGIFKTTDAGISWSQSGLSESTVYRLFADSSNIIYAGTEVLGIFTSSDNGATWTLASNGLSAEVIYSFVSDTTGSVIAGSKGAGIFRTTNHGQTWSPQNLGLNNLTVLSLAVDTLGTVLAGTEGGGIYYSNNDGLSWTQFNNVLTVQSVAALTVGSDGTIFAGTKEHGIYRSVDNGATWTPLSAGIGDKLVVDIYDDTAVADGSMYALVYDETSGGIYKYSATNLTWALINIGNPSKLTKSFAKLKDDNFIVGANDLGIYLTTNAGASWSQSNTGLINSHATSIATSGNSIVVGTTGGIFVTTDNGNNWLDGNAGLTNFIINSLTQDGSGFIYAATRNGIFRSSDSGGSWTTINTGLTDKNVNTIYYSAGNGIFAGTASGVFYSTNSGGSWVSGDMFNININKFASGSNGTLFSGTSELGVFSSSDGGDTWLQTTLDDISITALLVDSDNNIYAGTQSLAKTDPGIYISNDGGDSWQFLNTGLDGSTILELFEKDSGEIFCATERFGVFILNKSTAEWTRINDSLGILDVYDLAQDNNGYLYAATMGGGLFTSPVPIIANLESADIVYYEDDAPVQLTDSLIILQSQETILDSAVVSILANYNPLEDSLIFENFGFLTGVFDQGRGVLTISGDDVSSFYQEALRQVAYKNNNTTNPNPAIRKFSVKVYYGSVPSNSLERSIDVIRINDPPVLFGIPDITFNENGMWAMDLNPYLYDVDTDSSKIILSSEVISVEPNDTKVGVEDLHISINQETNVATFSATEDSSGIFTVVFTATDDSLATASDTTIVTVLPFINSPPVWHNIPSLMFDEDDSTTIFLNNYLSDANDSVTSLQITADVISAVSNGKKLEVSKSKLPDGSVLIQVGVNDLSILIDEATHKAVFKASADSSGNFKVVFTATDKYQAQGKDTIDVSVLPINDPPYVRVGITDFSFNEDSGVHTLISDVAFVFADPDPGDTLAYSIFSDNEEITAKLNGRVLTVESAPNYFGSAMLILSATDKFNAAVSDSFTVSILSVDDPPVLSPFPAIIFNEDESYTFELFPLVSDVDNSLAEIAWSYYFPDKKFEKAISDYNQNGKRKNYRNWREIKEYKIVKNKPHGKNAGKEGLLAEENQVSLTTIVLNGDSIIIFINDFSKEVTVSATSNFYGLNIPIVFVATDPGFLSDSAATYISVLPVNDPPVIQKIPEITFAEDDSLYYSVDENFKNYVSDVDNPFDSLKFIYDYYPESKIIVDTLNGGATLLFKAAKNWFGNDSLLLRVTDGIDTTSQNLYFEVTSVNDAPVLQGMPTSIEFTNDTTYALNIWDYAYDVETPDSLLLFDFIRSSDSLVTIYDSKKGILTLSARGEIEGNFSLTVKVTDDSGAVAQSYIPVTIEFSPNHWTNQIPVTYELLQNYPNPFNPSTTIRFGVPVTSDVRIEIFNVLGEKVGLLYEGIRDEGYFEVTWNPFNIPSGIYFYAMYAKSLDRTRDKYIVKKLMLLK
ncbi:MAG: tandem-95 repeat protein [Chlorobi bacterium]|nr:tandem-95 repeat protein [Chlorobiota bacterium]